MKSKGYLIFHLNLAFSSIEEEARSDVVQSCYFPLLDIIEDTEIPIGIELTGWTLKKIEEINPEWVKRFKGLLSDKKCELIGSGYCQIIGPLVPYPVNSWNQKLGLLEYNRILGIKPNIVLVNEMAYSSSLVELYDKYGYQGLVMDRDNVRLALGVNDMPMSVVPTHAQGAEGGVLPVLWADSILFQKVQHYVYGDIAMSDYIDYLKHRIDGGETILPIYCNDAEVFDYRPGRFSEERPTHEDGEWNRVKNLLDAITDETSMEWISPTKALELNNKSKGRKVSRLVSVVHPIPVKKQAKYNIARWAVTGRDDLWLNTMCHRIVKHLSEIKSYNSNDWRELCELWSSDLRTHITEKRWIKAKKQLSNMLYRHNISDKFGEIKDRSQQYDSLNIALGQYGGAVISVDKEGIILRISTKKVELELNLRRGLAIQSLSFASHEMEPCVGTLSHGYFSCISLGADYYSGTTIIELSLLRKRVTDLEKVEPMFLIKNNGNIEIHAEIKTSYGVIFKSIEVSANEEEVVLNYNFPKWDRITGSVRLGVITLLNQFNDKDAVLICANGGKNEAFEFNREVDHTKPASTLVSSSCGVGATTGHIQVIANDKSINLRWDPSESAVMPALQNISSYDRTLSRIYFSIQEMDDTVKKSSKMNGFTLGVTS